MLQQVFQLIQKVLSKWLNDAQVVEVSPDPPRCWANFGPKSQSKGFDPSLLLVADKEARP